MDLLLDKQTHDIVFVNGGCPITFNKQDVVAQRLTIRLKTLFAEWFLNIQYGVPYLERILGKKARKDSVDNILQSQILEEDGVRGITYFSSTLDANRRYTCTFRVRIETGQETQDITI